jgi:hypothetical protein
MCFEKGTEHGAGGREPLTISRKLNQFENVLRFAFLITDYRLLMPLTYHPFTNLISF